MSGAWRWKPWSYACDSFVVVGFVGELGVGEKLQIGEWNVVSCGEFIPAAGELQGLRTCLI